MANTKARKNTIWTKINNLRKKRLNKNGKVVKKITKQEQILRQQAAKKKGTTAHGRAVAKGLKQHKANVKKAAKNATTKRNRQKTMNKLYNK